MCSASTALAVRTRRGGSPAAEAAAIGAEALVGSGRGVGTGAVLADVFAGGQIVSERGWQVVHRCSTCGPGQFELRVADR